jgi:hypothetical protein
MRRLFTCAVLLALALAPSIARSQSSMSPAMVGVGAHGYDWLIGTWTCKNPTPSAMSGPAVTTLTVARNGAGALSVHTTGTNFDGLGYVVYAAKTKTWWNPSVLATGDYSTESSQQTGKKTLWAGTYYSAGKSNAIRDTYTMTTMTSFKDLSEAQVNGAWKTEANSTCTKS